MKPNLQSKRMYSAGRRGKATQETESTRRELSRQLAAVKKSMLREFGVALGGQGRMLESALNEAEAVAWQTPYPHLVFPMLAEEKASAVSRWAARQRSVRRVSREMSLSA